jgi:hypothetical protein
MTTPSGQCPCCCAYQLFTACENDLSCAKQSVRTGYKSTCNSYSAPHRTSLIWSGLVWSASVCANLDGTTAINRLPQDGGNEAWRLWTSRRVERIFFLLIRNKFFLVRLILLPRRWRHIFHRKHQSTLLYIPENNKSL